MDRQVAELVTAAAEITLGRKLSYWEMQVRKEKSKISEVMKRIEFWLKEIGKVAGGRGSMVERALKEARDHMKKTSSLLDPLSQVNQLSEGIPGPSKKSQPALRRVA